MYKRQDSSAASVWTAACILFEMLYGYHPFQMEPGEGIEEWAARVKSFDIKWPESGAPRFEFKLKFKLKLKSCPFKPIPPNLHSLT